MMKRPRWSIVSDFVLLLVVKYLPNSGPLRPPRPRSKLRPNDGRSSIFTPSQVKDIKNRSANGGYGSRSIPSQLDPSIVYPIKHQTSSAVLCSMTAWSLRYHFSSSQFCRGFGYERLKLNILQIRCMYVCVCVSENQGNARVHACQSQHCKFVVASFSQTPLHQHSRKHFLRRPEGDKYKSDIYCKSFWPFVAPARLCMNGGSGERKA